MIPFATEEVWSWWKEGSVHRAPWPVSAALRTAAAQTDPAHLAAAGRALAALRKVKSEAKLSMRTVVTSATLAVPTSLLALVEATADDVRAAGRAPDLRLTGDDALDGAEEQVLEVRGGELTPPEPRAKA